MRQLADEIRSPKYAHIERERRWLVDPSARPQLDASRHILIEDRDVIGTRLRLRRMTDSRSGATSLKLTKKYEGPRIARPIVTTYLCEAEYELLAALPANALAKRRFAVLDQGLEWSVDLFEEPLGGLELAEVECADDETLRACEAPAWAAAEVTNDDRYDGGVLARRAR